MSDEIRLPLDVEDFLTWLAAERGRSSNTLVAYRRDLTSYWAWLVERGESLDDVTGSDLDAYVGHLRERGLAPSSVKRALVAVRSLHRFRSEEGLAESDPSASIETPRVPAGLPKALTESEIDGLLAQVIGERVRQGGGVSEDQPRKQGGAVGRQPRSRVSKSSAQISRYPLPHGRLAEHGRHPPHRERECAIASRLAR